MASPVTLTYACNQTAVLAGGPAFLTFLVSNGTNAGVAVDAIGLAIPQGTDPSDLIAPGTQVQAGGIVASDGSFWMVLASGNQVSVLPVSATKSRTLPARATITFNVLVSAIATGGVGQHATIAVSESPSGQREAGTGSIAIGKTSAGFSIQNFAATQYAVDFGATITVAWAVAGATSCQVTAQSVQQFSGQRAGSCSGTLSSASSGSSDCAICGATLFTLTATGPGAGGAGSQTVSAQLLVASTPSPPAPYAGPRVLVPINVSAMIVTELLQQRKTFSCVASNPLTLQRFQPATPQAFASGEPGIGVTLQWTLPDALRQGAADQKTGETTFPLLPNRWLITRYAPDSTQPSGRRLSAWLIEGDYVGNDGTNLFALPTVRQLVPVMLGRSRDLASWTGETSGGELFLHAMAGSTPSFLAFTSGLANVFAFNDSAADVVTSNARLTYCVTGWYSDPAQDTLAAAKTTPTWQDLMQQLGWEVTQPTTPLAPPQITCHGTVANVFWPGKDYASLCTDDGQPISGVPLTSQTISSDCPGQPATTAVIAAGSTPLDAFASLVEYQLANQREPPDYDALTLLQAFFYDELIDYGSTTGAVRLNEKVRRTWFGSQPGGSSWTIAAKRNEDPRGAHGAPPPAPSDAIIADLRTLNQQQADLDRSKHKARAAQKELYQLWWKLQKATSPWTSPPLPADVVNQVTQAYQTARADVLKTLADGDARRTDRDAAKRTLDQALAMADTTLQVVEQTRARFYHPEDPVLLITGAVGNDKHGTLAGLKDRQLACRLPGQTLDAWSVHYDASAGTVRLQAGADPSCTGSVCATVGYADLGLVLENANLNAQLAAHAAPAETAAFVLESCLLDPGNADALLAIALRKMGQATPSGLAALVQQFRTQQLAFVTGADGERISDVPAAPGAACVPPAALSMALWQAPWSPLYMDWRVMWYPAVVTMNEKVTQWTFAPDNGTPAAYQWNGGLLSSGGIQLKGRTVLTSDATQLLGDWLQTRLEQYPPIDNPDLRTLATEIEGWDVLAQSMSGFHAMLAQLLADQHVPPFTDAAIIGSGDAATPSPGTSPDQPPPFNPLRAGQLVVQQLWIVDDFGQVFDPIQGADALAVVAGPGVGLTTDGSNIPAGSPPLSITHCAFGPAMVQASRLDFGFISAGAPPETADALETNPFDTPVCGYLLRNLLDRDLTVYDNGGQLLGSLYLSGANVLKWEANPEKVTSVGQPPDIKNPYLLAIVTGLLNQADNAAAFQTFLDELDLIVTKIDLSGAHYNQGLAMLIGRPIAVVRARLQFEYSGSALFNQSWRESGTKNTGRVDRIQWPVRLGGLQLPHDGLYGYYLDTADSSQRGYQTFHVVYDDPNLLPKDQTYVTPGDITLSYADASPTFVTMLMEPNSSVYAITGILPDTPIALAGAYTQGAIQNMDVLFRTGPLLSDPSTIKMVRPSNVYGSWSWIEHTGVQISTLPVAKADTRATFADTPPALREGWLRLTNAFSGSHDVDPSARPHSPFRAPYFRQGSRRS